MEDKSCEASKCAVYSTLRKYVDAELAKAKLDEDLKPLSMAELQREIMRYRIALRYHRDQEGHDRCWLDDVELYRLLPEGKQAKFTLPKQAEFLSGCAAFWQHRQECPEEY